LPYADDANENTAALFDKAAEVTANWSICHPDNPQCQLARRTRPTPARYSFAKMPAGSRQPYSIAPPEDRPRLLDDPPPIRMPPFPRPHDWQGAGRPSIRAPDRITALQGCETTFGCNRLPKSAPSLRWQYSNWLAISAQIASQRDRDLARSQLTTGLTPLPLREFRRNRLVRRRFARRAGRLVAAGGVLCPFRLPPAKSAASASLWHAEKPLMLCRGLARTCDREKT